MAERLVLGMEANGSRHKDAKISRVCRGYMEESCSRSRCRYIHDDKLCYHFWKHGECRFGAKCRDNHFVSSPKDMRPKSKPKPHPSPQPISNPLFRDDRALPARSAGRDSSSGRGSWGPSSGDRRSHDSGNIFWGPSSDDRRSSDSGSQIRRGPVNRPSNGSAGGDANGSVRRKNIRKPNYRKVKPKLKRRNTTNFEPSHEPADMRILVDLPGDRCSLKIQSKDVVLVPGLFCDPSDTTIYENLVSEILSCGIPEEDVLKLWHGDSHLIADDKTGWKRHSPTFKMVIEKIGGFFDMDIKATRFNWMRDLSEWKPFHHDAAAVKADKAATQNFTVAVSFGAKRSISFEDCGSKKVINFPLPNGTMYCFSRDINVGYKHGVPQVAPEEQRGLSEEELTGRISIVAWGLVEQTDV